jgi:hypothetical protein
MNNWSQQLLTFSKNLNKSSVLQQQPHKITPSKARDISKRKESGGNIVLRQLIDESIQSTGKSELEIIETIRFLVDKGKLVLVEDSGIITFRLHRNISEYEERQQRIQSSWLRADEIGILNILQEEKKELERSAILRLEHEEREQKNRIRKRRREHNQTIRSGGRRY